MTAGERATAPEGTRLSRRQALLIWLGQADRVALERDQLSALEGAGVHLRLDPSGAAPGGDAEPARAAPGLIARLRARGAGVLPAFLRPRG